MMPDPAPVLLTPRLRLRPPVLADAPAIERLVAERAVAETTGAIPHPYPRGGAEAFLRHLEATAAWARRHAFAVLRADDGALVGMVSITLGRPSDLGYYIGRPYWRRGYATEAVGRAMAHAFDELGATRFETRVFVGNAASARVLEKVGFEPLGEGWAHYPLRGGRRPVWRYRLGKARWRAMNAGGPDGTPRTGC